MIAVAGMAAALGLGDQHLDTISRQYGASYTAVRLALLIMYARAWRNVPETQNLVGGYLKGFSIEVVIWTISIFVPAPWRYVLWALGLVVSFATPWLRRREQVRVPLSVSHLPERFGLFTILVLGESIAAVVVGIENEDWALSSTAVGVAGVLLATSLWWVYFDNLEGSVVRRDPNKEHDWHPTAWIYSHLPLAVTLTMAGIGVEELVIASAGHDFNAEHRWLAASGVAGAYLAMAMILVSSSSPDGTMHFQRKALLRLGGAAAVVILAAAGGGLEPTTFGITIAGIAVVQVALDIGETWLSIRDTPPTEGVPGSPDATAEDAHAG
jgi:low temperature requirement protein LtrA